MTIAMQKPFAVSDIMSAASTELEMLCKKMETLQGLIDPSKTAVFDTHGLQDLDYITQSLEALSDFFEGLANDTPNTWSYDALPAADRVKLRDVADRLRGIDTVKSANQQSHDPDGIDLF